MDIPSATLSPQAAYRLLVGAVVPRPIAWVTSLSETGVLNAAPFSCFTFVCYSPPMIAISVGRKGHQLKDTSRNIAARREFVVNIASDDIADVVHQTSCELPPEESEIAALGLQVDPSQLVEVPRIRIAPVSMECRLHSTIEFGSLRTELIVGEILLFHVKDEYYSDGKIDSMRLRPLARLGGPRYMRSGAEIRSNPIPATFG
ncbi:flavin reductase family protein [Bradyrhizobium sp. LjRoot220]|uniref:flavin reductase family protein n=1 Tax=Bradyrhizobium sp. LjRoot220 TaxID=3342284 RepID=UPI003ECC29B2